MGGSWFGAGSRFAVVALAVVSLVGTLALPAAAEEPPLVPEPSIERPDDYVPPAPIELNDPAATACEWMGGLTVTKTSGLDTAEFSSGNVSMGASSARSIEVIGVSSTASDGSTCSSAWQQSIAGWAVLSPVSTDECGTTRTVLTEGELSSATGTLNVGVDGEHGMVGLSFSDIIDGPFSGPYTETGFLATHTTYTSPCGEPTTTTDRQTFVDGPSDSINCDANVTEASQAFLVSCHRSQIEDDTYYVEVWTGSFRRSVCNTSVDSDGDGVGDCDEYAQGTDPALPGDGQTPCSSPAVPTWMSCPSDPGGGTGGDDDDGDEPLDCHGASVQKRGFTATHYDADLDVTLAPDPDFFDWNVSATWCVEDDVVKFDGLEQLGLVTLDPLVGTPLEVLGVTFRHDPTDPESFITSTSGAAGSVIASTDFDVCVNPFALLSAGSGTVIKNFATSGFARRVFGAMPRSGSVSAWVDDALIRLDNALLPLEERIVSDLRRVLTSSTASVLPEVLRQRLLESLNQSAAAIGLALRGQDPTNSLSMAADQGFRRFLGVYGEGGAIVIPRTEQAAARQLWNEILADFASEAVGLLSDAVEFTHCETVWQPTLEIVVPKSGESFVDDSAVDRSIFDVTGGIIVNS